MTKKTPPELRALGVWLRIERERREWGRRTLARRLLDVIDDRQKPTHVTVAGYIKNWESGEVQITDPRYRAAYATVFGIPEGELFGGTSGAESRSSGTPTGSVDFAVIPDDGEDDVKRRELFQDTATVTVGAAVAPVLAALTQAWQASQPTLPGATVSQAMIDDWEDAAAMHAQRARVDPPIVVLGALATDYAAMAPHLARSQPDRVARDLAHAAAQLAMLIAGKWVDLGNRRESRRWWRTTRALGDRSRDPLLASWLRSREALYRRGDPTENLAEVLAIARDARRLAGEGSSPPLVSALTAEAQILAQMGSHTAAVTMLHRAETVFDRMPTTPAHPNWPDWSGWMHREEGLYFDKSFVYALAGDVPSATEAHDVLLSRAADTLAATEVGLHRATLYARTDPESGIEHAARIVDGIPGKSRRTRYLTAARMVLDVAPERARTLPAARELRALTTGT
jgi:hypothetical protein